jgi:UDP-N-acetylmuramate-alanine ligase
VLASLAEPGDFIITMGAGSIGALPPRVVAALRRRFEQDLAVKGGAA